MKFYSQYGQDKWLYENYFKGTKGGTFLEIGADDGIDKSNTMFFEETMGWSGICIEPSPERFKLLKRNRECICERVAISDRVGETQFLDIRGWGKGLSGIVENYPKEHLHRIDMEMKHPKNNGSEMLTVQADLLNNVLSRNDVFEIDFCTIDTEGSEFEILDSLDFEKYKIRIILVENNYNENKVRYLLADRGYSLVGRVGPIDDAYVLNDTMTM